MMHSGGGDAGEWLVPKAMWLAAHEPEQYRDADVICECLDWVIFQLTGSWVGSRMNATCKWNYDGIEQRLLPELYASFGVPDLGARLPQRIVAVGSPIERISAAAAGHLSRAVRCSHRAGSTPISASWAPTPSIPASC